MKIKACPRCGSRQISMGGIGDGVLYGIDSWKEVCRNCNYQGAPILFNSKEEYKKFFSELNKDDKKKSKKSKEKPPKINDSIQNNKINSDEKEISARWKIFLISIVISIFITFIFVYYFLSIYDMSMAILSIVGQFIISLFTIFVLLLFIRFILKSIKHR